MKKITLLLAAILTCGIGFSQTENYVSETGGMNDPIVYMESNYQYTPCGHNNASNDFENGKSCTKNLGRIVAHDISFPSDENLRLESITANIFMGATGSGVYASFVDIFLYEDDNGSPGNIIAAELGFVTVIQDVVGTNYGYDVWRVLLDIDDYTLHGGSGSTTTFWIGLAVEATDGSNVFWENSTIGLIGYGEAYDNGASSGFVIDPELEGVYTFTGDCMPRLGIDDNLADLVNIYPNPATNGIVNIETAVPGEKQVVVFDILGKKVIDTVIVNTELNVSTLKAGIYMVQVTQNDSTAVVKLIVK